MPSDPIESMHIHASAGKISLVNRRTEAYRAYLRSPAWFRKRAQVLARDRGLCRRCGRKAVHVHHLTYRRLFHERLSDLVSVCKPCHAEIHARKRLRFSRWR